ncbi:MAG TPA: tetratricopeptide repeat protein [Verrucomicrobiae bacterium]|jgi:tetratricopeptide (TPR) repeat protein|nr:tetratricopeptide repeat protein [Verrucomicrobiae bacterium]
MRRKPPRWIFRVLFVFAVALCARAQQPPPASSMSPKQLEEERAKVQMAEKRYDASIQTYLDLLKSDPKNALYMNMLGIAYLDLSNYDQAKRFFTRSVKADKKYSSAVNNLGMVYYHQKNYRGAIREYQRALTIDPLQAGTHSNLGFAYYNTNKFPEAAAEFQKALEIDPTIFERNDRAGAMVQDRSVTNHGLFFFTMAKIYAQKGDAPHCAEYLRKSIDEGYKDIAKVTTDPAFKDVINDPAVQEVLARVAPADPKGSATHPGD